MQTFFLKNPRVYSPRQGSGIEISDQGKLQLAPDEQITLITEDGGEVDVCRKNWGFYPVPSLNSRLPRLNLRPVLIRNRIGHFFLLLMEKGKEKEFGDYVSSEQLEVIGWLDNDAFLAELNGLAKDENK